MVWLGMERESIDITENGGWFPWLGSFFIFFLNVSFSTSFYMR